jgi:hypothetical protein
MYFGLFASWKSCWPTKTSKHFPTNLRPTTKAVFSVWSVPRLYIEHNTRSHPCYDYITKLCSRQAEVILNHENPNVRAIGQGDARHRKHKVLTLDKYLAMGPSGARCQVWACRLVAGSKLLLLVLREDSSGRRRSRQFSSWCVNLGSVIIVCVSQIQQS